MSLLGNAVWSLGYAVGSLRIVFLVFKYMYRRYEVRFLANLAMRRKESALLAVWIEEFMLDRTKLVSKVETLYCFGIGYPKNADGTEGPICWNVPIAITVYLVGKPYFGLGIEFRGKALCIRQMQGVKGAIVPDRLKDWPDLLVRTCMIFAEEKSFREVRVYKADQDFNFKRPVLDPSEDGMTEKQQIKQHQDRMRRRYDRVAQKLKFQKKKRYYVWYVPPKSQLP